MPKITLVDIDSTLVLRDTELNLALIEKLHEFDEVILFTQRSKHVQTLNLRGHISGNMELEVNSSFLIIGNILNALRRHGIHANVSTSLDHVVKRDNYYLEVDEHIHQLMSNIIRTYPGYQESQQGDASTYVVTQLTSLGEPETPLTKVEPFRYLLNSLYLKYPGQSIQITFFDDNEDNLTEVGAAFPKEPIRLIQVTHKIMRPLTLEAAIQCPFFHYA